MGPGSGGLGRLPEELLRVPRLPFCSVGLDCVPGQARWWWELMPAAPVS